MRNLLLLFCTFLIFSTVKSGSHSLWTYATLIVGETPFPEFSAVLILDNHTQVGYFDSNGKNFVFRGDKALEHYIDRDDHQDAIQIYNEMYNIMRKRAAYFQHHYNLTSGIHVEQRQFGCELLEDDVPGKTMTNTAFDGVKGDEIHFNIHLRSFQSQFQCRWPGMATPDKNTLKDIYTHIYHPVCVRALRKCLNISKSHPARKVTPSISFFQRTLSDSGGTKMTCLATGFYPRDIHLTLFKEGQPVSDHQITGGEMLPNGDGTYQMRKSLEVRAEESKNPHNYRCIVDHPSLDNSLDKSLETSLASGSHGLILSCGVLGAIGIISSSVIVALVRKKCQGPIKPSQSHKGNYTAAPDGVSSESNGIF